MDWKTNLKAAKMAFSQGMKKSKMTPRQELEEDLQKMNEKEIAMEQVLMLHDINKRLAMVDKEVLRIRNNVVFFFWVTMVFFFFWIILIAVGGLAGIAAFAS